MFHVEEGKYLTADTIASSGSEDLRVVLRNSVRNGKVCSSQLSKNAGYWFCG